MPDSIASPAASVALTPLVVPRANPAFQPIRRLRRSSFGDATPSPAALIPLFSVALLYIGGICLGRIVYLRPGLLLLSLFAFACIVLWAAFHAPRLTWLPMALLWIGLGTWSEAMEPAPVPDAQLAQFASDGLLRTIEGTIAIAEPLRDNAIDDQSNDRDAIPENTETPLASGSLRQQVDLDVSAAEAISDAYDRIEPLPRGPATRVRLQVLLLHGGAWLARCLGGLTLGDLRIPEPGALRTAVALGFFVTAVWLIRIAISLKQKRLQWAGLLALGAMAIVAVAPQAVRHPQAALLFEAIDVGQGDSLLLITPDGHTLLVDSGGLGLGFLPQGRRVQAAFDTGEDLVSPVLWERGIRRLDAVALTHAHRDHMGGLPAILRNFRPTELWVGENPPVESYRELLQEADSLGVQLRRLTAGEDFTLGEAEVRVFAPAAGYKAGTQPANNDSLVLRLSYDTDSVLLTGDAESGEEHAMSTQAGLASTVLKIGHHGSVTSTGAGFLAAVHPQWAVISCGRKNRFGHPRQEILEELQAAHVKTYRTDSNGAMCLLLDGKSVTADIQCGR